MTIEFAKNGILNNANSLVCLDELASDQHFQIEHTCRKSEQCPVKCSLPHENIQAHCGESEMQKNRPSEIQTKKAIENGHSAIK